MKRQPRILAGTAIGLFMASAPLGALPLPNGAVEAGASLPLVRVQADCQEGESAEACAARQGGEQEPRRKQRREAPTEQAAPQEAAPEPQAEEQAPRRKQRREAPVEQAAPQEAAPEPQAEEQAPRRKQKREAPVEQAAPQEAAPEPQAEEPAPRRKQRREAPVEQAAPQEAAPEPQAEEQAPRRKREPAAEQPQETQAPTPEAAPKPEPQAEQTSPKRKPRDKAPAEEAQPAVTPEVAPKPEPQPEQQPQAEQPKAEQPAEKPAEATPEQVPTPAPAPQTQTGTGEVPASGEQPAPEQPAQGEQPETGEQPVRQPAAEQPAQQGEAPVNPNEAPILDSQKEMPAQVEGSEKPSRGEKPGKRPAAEGQGGEQAARPQPLPVDQGPPPVDDKSATEAAQPVEIQAVTSERGKRRERAPEVDLRRQPRPEGTEVLREIGDRLIIQLNNQVIVESNDRPRLTRNAQEVYYEDLPRGRTREVILRENGNQIITIRNRYGDIVQRSRITPNGREYVLSYVDDQYYGEIDEWRDPGLDLPPLMLHIPRNEYILDAQYVEDPEVYYDFLEQPPVERVQRLYSVDEVKRSARVRDIARRVDLDTLSFEFGSASIAESEITKLEGVANAMDKLLQKNPAETFLIEGHTDAVGSDVANLALSDRRAESVADALTNVFGIPPENLSTQGYGERYLKVKTDRPERENRRVAIRRITPLVAPIASAQ